MQPFLGAFIYLVLGSSQLIRKFVSDLSCRLEVCLGRASRD
jgi:hypothetical protein